MTRIALPQIVSDFPDFQYDEMKQRAENALTQYLQAVTAQNVEILRGGNEDLKRAALFTDQRVCFRGQEGTFYTGKDPSDGDCPIPQRGRTVHRDISVCSGKFPLCDR